MTWQARLRRADFAPRASVLAALLGLAALVLALVPHEREVEAGGILRCGSVVSPGPSTRQECASALQTARHLALVPASLAGLSLLSVGGVSIAGRRG